MYSLVTTILVHILKYSIHSSISLVPRPHMAWERGYSSMCSDSEYGSSYYMGYVCVPFLGGKLAGQTHRFPAAEVAIAGPVHNTC